MRIDGVQIGLRVVEEGCRGLSSRTQGNGRLQVKFGAPGDLQQFPEPKAGFDATRLAGEISAFVELSKRRERQAAELAVRRRAQQAIADALNAEASFTNDWAAYAFVSKNWGDLKVKIEVECTEEQVRALLAAAKEILGRGAR